MRQPTDSLSGRNRMRDQLDALDTRVLTDAELLALLLSERSRDVDVRGLARLLGEKGGDLRRADFASFPGLDEADVTLLLAAIQLASRRVKPKCETESGRPTNLRLVRSAAVGIGYFFIVSLVLSEAQPTFSPFKFLATFVSLLAALLGAFFVCLELGFRGVKQPRGRHVQMRLSSLFLWITVAALNLVVLRLFLGIMSRGNADRIWESLPAALIAWLLFIAFSTPFVMLLGESLLWLSADLVRRPGIRQLWTALRPRKD